MCFQRSVSMLDATMRAGCASTRANVYLAVITRDDE